MILKSFPYIERYTMAGLESWWGLHWIIVAPVAYIPLLGSIVGMVGAVDAWGWQDGALFFGGLIITFIFGGMSMIASPNKAYGPYEKAPSWGFSLSLKLSHL